MITAPDISGKAPYGRGEETRPNNLTYVITANNASIDDDLAIRAYFIQLDVVAYSATWATDVNTFIRNHRLNILADIIDILNNHQPFSTAPNTRFPEFETKVLQAFCADAGAYSEVISAIGMKRSESNIDEERGKEIEDVFRHQLIELGVNPNAESAWIRSKVAEEWLAEVFPDSRANIQAARVLAKSGYCSHLDPKIVSYPRTGERRRGIMWVPDSGDRKPAVVVLKKLKSTIIQNI